MLCCHWSTANRLKKRDAMIIAACSSHVPKAETKRHVSLHVILGRYARARDNDNWWKVLLDCMVKCRILVDDSPRWCSHDANVTYERGKQNVMVVTLLNAPELEFSNF